MNHTISNTDYVELSTFAEEQWHKVLNYLGRTFNLPREDCQDVFQDAFIVLYDQINEGRLTPLKCSLSTYFTSICRYKALELLRHNNRSITTDYTNLATDNEYTNQAPLIGWALANVYLINHDELNALHTLDKLIELTAPQSLVQTKAVELRHKIKNRKKIFGLL